MIKKGQGINKQWLNKRAEAREEDGLTTRETKLVSLARKIEEHPYVRLMAVIGIFAALIAFGFDLNDRRQERADRKEERIARSWQILTKTAPGNSGKKHALVTLHRYGERLHGLDLSCETLGGEWVIDKTNDPKGAKCHQGAYLAHMDLNDNEGGAGTVSEMEREGIDLLFTGFFADSNLNGAELYGSNLLNNYFSRTDFTAANLNGTRFSGSHFDNVIFHQASLRGANFEATGFENVKFDYSQSQDANFTSIRAFDVTMNGARLNGATFTRAILRNVDFAYSDLTKAFFLDTDFEDYKRSELAKVRHRFRGANLTATDFTYAKGLKVDDFIGAFSDRNRPPIGLPKNIMDSITLCDKEKIVDVIWGNQSMTEQLYLMGPNCEPQSLTPLQFMRIIEVQKYPF